ncbi:hypothetical protein DICSQDRAFT_110426 [Dichomitus squalens LYAD-421 SS1]|uniref:Uncharacterized protein n=2 Tax=Dichomitus squalens TaxID=114155 RepID=A0A4Q9PT29_9APHY|nr:uncharacterized protein DICSQDRAFT_110426 [Dichomitus squalens LYAD-421 SS1]EJF58295.1 hypothetical protein DICSQDRAFT_110426 [Dichomitus squalens LYAD-421 SS1]TBU21287.1 hypothetical protein BD311DRAFT_869982 [Dichomitus squalens]TBU57599.1 hypothetical protein BD310DRAFT_928998 [Dichomitus squalens]
MDDSNSRRIDKGKGRAHVQDEEASENTPLLGSASGSLSSSRDIPIQHPNATRRRIYSRLVSVFLISLSFTVLVFVLLAIVAYSWRSRASATRPEEIIKKALIVRGPDRVDVLNATSEDGIWLLVHGRMGLDAGSVVGVKTDKDDSVVQDWFKGIGRWGIRQIDRVTVTMSDMRVGPRAHPNMTLATVSTPSIEVQLTANPPARDLTWLTPVQIPVRIQPTKDIDDLLHFVRESWKSGFLSIQATVGQAVVRGGGLEDHGWRTRFTVAHSNVRPVVNVKIPSLPGLPPAGDGHQLPGFSDLVHLQSFNIASRHGTIELSANATALNPVPLDVEFEAPALPFLIHLPQPESNLSSVAVASVHSHPFQFTHPNISLTISGAVVPLPRDSSSALSAFVSKYISGRDADIEISTPLYPGLTINTTFPAPHPRPQILRNVSISDMRIKPVGATMFASGVVHALVVLPKGIDVGVNASRLFPDVLVFDGEVPTSDEPGPDETAPLTSALGHPSPPPTRPLPEPLPPRAFAHIVPDDWIPAECREVEAPPDSGSTVAVSAQLVDVPLEVLPGREREFSDFMAKVIFGSQGALAGVQGVAAVAVRVEGLPFANGQDPEMELAGLPFQGSVRIGKKVGSLSGPA